MKSIGEAICNSFNKADTSHIKTCERLWYNHLANCDVCHHALNNRTVDHIVRHFCTIGRNLWDERCLAIEANRDTEVLCATTPTQT